MRVPTRLSIYDGSWFNALPTEKDYEKDLTPSERVIVEKALKMVCTSFLQTPMYKSGDTTKQAYKTCCEIGNYCSFMNTDLFYILATAGGLILLNIISVGIIAFFLYKKNKKYAGGVPTKGGKSTELF